MIVNTDEEVGNGEQLEAARRRQAEVETYHGMAHVFEEVSGQEDKPVDAEAPLLAQMMGATITEALGETPTPESCEHAIELATAARDFLTALRKRQHRPLWVEAAENLQRLAEEFGAGREDDDGPP